MKEPKYKIGDKVYWVEEQVKADEVRAVILVTPVNEALSPYYGYVVGEIWHVEEEDFDFTLKGGFPVLRREEQLFPSKQSLIDSL